MRIQRADLLDRATADLTGSFGASSGRAVTAWAPGRCTLVGEHVDYVGGLVACVAIDLGVAVALRPSSDGLWRARSGDRLVERGEIVKHGDIGDRIFAPAAALALEGIAVPPVEVAVAASLPESAGLSSSAALLCAVEVAMLRLTGTRLAARRVANVALRAERDIVGVPVGPLDHRAVVEAPADGVLIVDCRDGTTSVAPWPWSDIVLAVCDTGVGHDVGGTAYRARRREAEVGLSRLGATTCRDIDASALEPAGLTGKELRRVRHVVTESERTSAAVRALWSADEAALGAIMSASHASLRRDYDVSTPELDAAVSAASGIRDCFGARLVGAGFGGTAIGLVRKSSGTACAAAMVAAVGPGAHGWTLQPASGMAAANADVIR